MEWNEQDYRENAFFVTQYGEEIIKMLQPKAGEKILDLGCGTGELSQKIASYGANVIGVDSSAPMVNVAQKAKIEAYVVNADSLPYKNQFDAVFSNAALHWMKNADTVIANVYRTLKIGGRFCAEMGGKDNVAIIVAGIYLQLKRLGLDGNLYNPWYFPSQEEYERKLQQAGFSVKSIITFPRWTLLPKDIAGWLKTFAKPFLVDIAASEHHNFITRVMDSVAPQLKDNSGQWFADYTRLRFEVHK